MNSSIRVTTNRFPALAALLVLLMAMSATLRSDVVLVPGYIEGTVQIGDEAITFLRVRATNADDSAVQTQNPNVVTASYSLTVNVPQGTMPDYDVRAENVYTTDPGPFNIDYFTFAFEQVTAEESATKTVDFILTDPAYVSGNVLLNGDGEIDYFYIYGTQVTTNGYSHYTFQRADDSERNNVAFNFPVFPGEIRCTGLVYLTSGARISLPVQTVTAEAGGSQSCNYEIGTPETGAIEGAIEYNGSMEPNYFYVYTSFPTARNWTATDPNNPDIFSLPELSEGNYSLSAYAYLNDFDDQFWFPSPAFSPSRNTAIEAGDVNVIDIYSCQTYLNGNFLVHGSASPADLSTSYLRFFGASPASQSGQGVERLHNGDISFELPLSTGSWRSNYFDLRLSRPDSHEDGYLYTQIFLYDQSVMPLDNPVSFAECGASVTRDFDYRFGQVTVNFSIAGGGTMSSPRLQMYAVNCAEEDEGGNLLYTYRIQIASSNQSNVEVGSVTFLAPQAQCTDIEALAFVGGSLTSFGSFDLEVVGGTDVIIDIGGPQVSVTSPESEVCLADDEVTVTGTATDDVGVVSVTVNGEPATLDPAGGEGTLSTDFSATILLDPGPNEIETIATDTAEKTGSDTRTVYLDAGPPVLDWTPADGAVTSEAGIEVAGTVSDDVDVESVTVNGDAVVLEPTGNTGEYSFSTTVELEDGENMITVVATDTSNCGDPTTEVRKVTLSDNTGPTVDDVQVSTEPVGVESAAEAMCLFSDPDTGDSHTVEWDWGDGYISDGSVDGLTASGSHNYTEPGIYTVTCTVNDAAGESDSGQSGELVVYDPNGGFVTGGGWFRSPEEAYTADDWLEGRKVNFGMVSKYRKNDPAPRGSVEFNAKRFNFHSNTLHWMIILDDWVQVAGMGTIDGEGTYPFRLTLIDTGKSRDPDSVRFQIWDGAEVVYDNRPGAPNDTGDLTELGGGNLVIHTRR